MDEYLQRQQMLTRQVTRAVPNRAPGYYIPGVSEREGGQPGVAPGESNTLNAFRGDYSVFPHTGSGEFVKVVGTDRKRCYLEIQNNSGATLFVNFGNNGGSFQVQPLATWYSPVAVTNEIWLNAPVGAQCAIVLATDL